MEKFAKGQLKTLIFKFIAKDETRLKNLDNSLLLFQKKYPNVTKTQFNDRAEMYKNENLDLENKWEEFSQEKKEEIVEIKVTEEKIPEEKLVLNNIKPTLKKNNTELEDIHKLTIASYKNQIRDSINRMNQNWGDNLTASQKNYLEVLAWNEMNAEKFLKINTESNIRKQKLKF